MAESNQRGLDLWRQGAFEAGRQLELQSGGRSEKRGAYRRQEERLPDGTVIITEEYISVEETEWRGGGDYR